MSIIIPLEGEEAIPISATFAGATVLSVSSEIVFQARATFVGSTVLTINGTGIIAAGATFLGETLLSVTARLNSEANVFGAATFVGETVLQVGGSVRRSGGARFVGSTDLTVNGTVVAAEEFGFTIFADIRDSAASTAITNKGRRYNVRLKANGVEVPIISASLEAPADKLGIELSVVLAIPDVNQVAFTDSISFEVALWYAGAFHWIDPPILENAKLSSRSKRTINSPVGAPADEVTLTFVDVLADRSNLRPAQNRIYYDSDFVPPPTVEALSSLTIYDSNGMAITPLFVGVPGLTLYQVLNLAFVGGCGFSKVVTNIPNFPAEQSSFSLTGGYDAGVRPFISIYDPLAFVVANDLWLITLDEPLPAGISARTFSAGNIESLDDSFPAREPINGLLVTVKQADGEFFVEFPRSNMTPAGEFGTPGYTETTVNQTVRQYKLFSAPDVVVREEITSEVTEVVDFEFRPISRETRTDHFDALNRPTGYSSSTEQLVPDMTDPAGSLLLQKTKEETQSISYSTYPLDPSKDVQSRIETHTAGLIVVDPDNTYLDEPYKIRIQDAHRSGFISPGGSQTTIFGATRSVVKVLDVKGGQVRMIVRTTDHIANIEDTRIETLPGDATIDRRRQSWKTRTILIRSSGTTSTPLRRLPQFDATGLPQNLGIERGYKRLAALNSPPNELSISLPYYDPTIRRGTDLNVESRNGSIGVHIVRGYSGQFVMRGGILEATQRLDTRELKA